MPESSSETILVKSPDASAISREPSLDLPSININSIAGEDFRNFSRDEIVKLRPCALFLQIVITDRSFWKN
jgi:hypothetical protein